jgi:hypothetical protein
MGRSDYGFPRVGGQFSFGEEPSNVIVEDLGRRAGDRVEARLTELEQELLVRDAALRGAAHDLHRAERMDMHARHPRLHGADQVSVEGAG